MPWRLGRVGLALALSFAWVLVASAPAECRIVKTRRPGQPGRQVLLTVGGGFEYETDPEESEFGYPLLIELGISRDLKLGLEPIYTVTRSKSGEQGTNLSGWGDVEATLEYEFVHERRWRPAFTAASIIKWPSATSIGLGTGERDYAIGLILSKEFVGCDMDLSAIYTFVGDPPGLNLQNATDLSLASAWNLSDRVDLEGEFGYGGGGGLRGRTGSFGGLGGGGATIGASENLFEGTLGVGERLGEYLKLEQGVVAKSDGSWQFLLGWEWDFEGNR